LLTFLFICVYSVMALPAGGCAAPGIINGPVHEVLGRMQLEGKSPLGHIDQVHAALDMQLAKYMAARAVPMAPPMHPEL
jgi:hypothetical protein